MIKFLLRKQRQSPQDRVYHVVLPSKSKLETCRLTFGIHKSISV